MFSVQAPRRLLAFSVTSMALVAGCADTRGGSIPYNQVMAARGEVKFQTLETNYKIAPTDKLAIKVFKMQDLTGDYDVDLAGNISLPLIGEIRVVNLTTAEVDDDLTRSSDRNISSVPTSAWRSRPRPSASSQLTER